MVFVVLGLAHYLRIPKSIELTRFLPVVGLSRSVTPRVAAPRRGAALLAAVPAFDWFPDGGQNRDEENCAHHRDHGAGWLLLSRVPLGEGLLGSQGPWSHWIWCWESEFGVLKPVQFAMFLFFSPSVLRDPESNPNSDCTYFGVLSKLLVGMIESCLNHFSKSPKSPLFIGIWYVPSPVMFKWSAFQTVRPSVPLSNNRKKPKRGYVVHGILRRSSSFNTSRIDHIFDKASRGVSSCSGPGQVDWLVAWYPGGTGIGQQKH